MLDLKGAFVVVRQDRVETHVLNSAAFDLFMDRIMVAGSDKANVYQFGTGTLFALPCIKECLENVALNYEGIHSAQVKAICALIVLGRAPYPNQEWNGLQVDKDNGGLGVVADNNKPIKPKGSSGVKVNPKPKVTAESLTAMISG